jgi:DNA integrity scanning protein DisA with diadenylate cyclase activity
MLSNEQTTQTTQFLMKPNPDLADLIDDHKNEIERLLQDYPEKDWHQDYGSWKDHLQDLIDDLNLEE